METDIILALNEKNRFLYRKSLIWSSFKKNLVKAYDLIMCQNIWEVIFFRYLELKRKKHFWAHIKMRMLW